MTRRCMLLAFLAAGSVAAPVAAHHSVAGQFDFGNTIKLTGVISEIDWINPHTYVHLEVADESGQVTTWQLESLPTAMLRKAGLTKEMIMDNGAVVTVDAVPARDGTGGLGYLLRITYPDGHYYQLAAEEK